MHEHQRFTIFGNRSGSADFMQSFPQGFSQGQHDVPSSDEGEFHSRSSLHHTYNSINYDTESIAHNIQFNHSICNVFQCTQVQFHSTPRKRAIGEPPTGTVRAHGLPGSTVRAAEIGRLVHVRPDAVEGGQLIVKLTQLRRPVALDVRVEPVRKVDDGWPHLRNGMEADCAKAFKACLTPDLTKVEKLLPNLCDKIYNGLGKHKRNSIKKRPSNPNASSNWLENDS